MAEQENEPNIIEKIVSFFSGGGNGATPAGSNDEANDGDADVGFLNSLAMGFGFKDPTDDYYRATLDSIRHSQGQRAAEAYRDRILGQGVLSMPGALDNYDIATGAITGMPQAPVVPQIPAPQAPMMPMQNMQPPIQQGVGSLMQAPGTIQPLV